MKKFRLIIRIAIFLITFSLRVNSQEESLYNNNYNSFADGEMLEYKLKYGFFNTSYASLSLNEINLLGKENYALYDVKYLFELNEVDGRL